MPIIWGNKIGLRPFEDPISDDEAACVYRWSRDAELLRWSGGTPTELSLAEFRERLRGDNRIPSDQRRAFLIVTRTNKLIGRIGCFALDWARRDGELGIVIGETAEWGKGYGRAAVLLLLPYLFETTPLERVYLFTYPDNVRAQRCFAACGFRSLGSARRFSAECGEYDGVEMEITRREFAERANPQPCMPFPASEKCPSEPLSR